MKKMVFILFVPLVMLQQNVAGQGPLILNAKPQPVTGKKVEGLELLIPLDLEFINPTGKDIDAKISITIDNTQPPVEAQADKNDIDAGIKMLNDKQDLKILKGTMMKPANTTYLFIDKSIVFINDKTFYLVVKDGAVSFGTIKVVIQADDKPLTVTDYMENNEHDRTKRKNRLDYVTKVESSDNILTVSGYKEITAHDNTKHTVFLKKKVELQKGQVLSVSEWSCVGQMIHWKPWPISIITIPFKIRPGITSNGNHFKSSATAGITNVGFNIDLGKYQKDRYFATGKKSTHKFAIGLFITPGVEELDSIYTNGLLGKAPGKLEKSKQLFISTGFTISYSYNDISFVFVPYARDFGTSTTGKKWLYHDTGWWGFGIAIGPKVFSTILNK